MLRLVSVPVNMWILWNLYNIHALASLSHTRRASKHQGMHPYHHASKEEKILSSSKKVMSLLKRYWKGVIPSESSWSATSGTNWRYALIVSPLKWGLAHIICNTVICWSWTSAARSIPWPWKKTAISWGLMEQVLEQAWWNGKMACCYINHWFTSLLFIIFSQPSYLTVVNIRSNPYTTRLPRSPIDSLFDVRIGG